MHPNTALFLYVIATHNIHPSNGIIYNVKSHKSRTKTEKSHEKRINRSCKTEKSQVQNGKIAVAKRKNRTCKTEKWQEQNGNIDSAIRPLPYYHPRQIIRFLSPLKCSPPGSHKSCFLLKWQFLDTVFAYGQLKMVEIIAKRVFFRVFTIV